MRFSGAGCCSVQLNRLTLADCDFSQSLAMLEGLPATPGKCKRMAELFSNRGHARIRLRRLDDAIDDLTRSLKLIETTEGVLDRELLATALHNRGNAFYEQGRVPAAIEDLRKAKEIRHEDGNRRGPRAR